VCVLITAGPITKLFAGGEEESEDMCYERRRAEACVITWTLDLKVQITVPAVTHHLDDFVNSNGLNTYF
jgi:hypothetical protein